MNRDQKRKGDRAVKGLSLEPRRLIIAGLQVLTSNAIPTGAMVVNPAEADVLQAMVDEASNQKAVEQAQASDDINVSEVKTTEEGDSESNDNSN
jgi:hypothetical protein